MRHKKPSSGLLWMVPIIFATIGAIVSIEEQSLIPYFTFLGAGLMLRWRDYLDYGR